MNPVLLLQASFTALLFHLLEIPQNTNTTEIKKKKQQVANLFFLHFLFANHPPTPNAKFKKVPRK